MRVLALLLFAFALRADQRTQDLAERLAQQAEAFQKMAPDVLGRETLLQSSLVGPPRFKMRVGRAAEQPLQPAWQERQIISQYGFAVFGGQAVHELRQVTSVNGKRVAGEREAQEELAKLVISNDEQRKRRALHQLEKYGMQGGATDFGQILLLFSRANLERYEITYTGERMVAPVRMQTFHYKQLDGPAALTVFREGDPTQRLSVEGEIWVRDADGSLARITLVATDKNLEDTLQEEAAVDYAPSAFGTVLPSQTTHTESRAGEVVTVNTFYYDGFHRYGAQPVGGKRE